MRTFNSDGLCQAWSILHEYHDLCCMAWHRKDLNEQLHDANIPLTYVPWKSMVRAMLCRYFFSDEELRAMSRHTSDCYEQADVTSSEDTLQRMLEHSKDENERSLTETWFELNELKERFQKAQSFFSTIQPTRREFLNQILGYPAGYSIDDMYDNGVQGLFDLQDILSIEQQSQMHTGDLIEFSGNRLHDAFYIYRLPAKGIWAQIQQMWFKHEISEFVFNNSEHDTTNEEIILVPAMDEYGYGVPYLFAQHNEESLPNGALYKYVDINFSLVSNNQTIALVQQHLNQRLENPVYKDHFAGEEMRVEPDRFPQEYVAIVDIAQGQQKNVSWTRRVHYSGEQNATDLNDNIEIFFSRRILESEVQYRQKKTN